MVRTIEACAAPRPSLSHRGHWVGMLTIPLLVACLVTSVATAQEHHEAHDAPMPTHWRFDPDHSRIDFELAALGMFGIQGRFPRFEGGAVWDPQRREWRIETDIDATSLVIKPARYLSWARSVEFFDVLRHSRVLFRSDPAPESLLRNGGELTGRLELRGIERAVWFQVAPAQCEPDLRACLFQVSGEIDRRQFGMDSRRMTLSSRVALRLQLLAMSVQP